jgi:hypothetical protein
LLSQYSSNFVAPFDNTAGFDFGMAFVNPSVSPAEVTFTVTDENGASLGTRTFTLTGRGHAGLALKDLFPSTENRRGIVKFQSTGSSGLSGLGLRFTPFRTFTSVPGT